MSFNFVEKMYDEQAHTYQCYISDKFASFTPPKNISHKDHGPFLRGRFINSNMYSVPL